tara:strand:+ start:4560 stop:6089 length:1530 start_codon:yes stop_codon:yes gene_type:complete
MWTDTSGSSFTGLTNGEPLSISQQPYSTYPTPLLNSQGSPALTASLSPTSFTGVGSGITLGVTQSFVGAGPLVAMEVYIESTGSGYTAGDQLTFSTTDLTAAGFIKPVVDTDLIVDIQAGDILFITSSESNKVKYIKMSNSDINGVSILPFIQDSEYVTFNLTGAQDYLGNLIEGYQTWFISNVSVQDDNNASTEDATLIIVNQEPSSDAINSYDSAFYDLSFSASGVYSYYSTASGEDPNVIPSIGITQSVAQGYFPPISTFPTESFFRGWAKSNYFQSNTDGTVYRVETGSGFSSDNLGNFNTGSVEMDFDPSVPYTSSKIPWFMNAVASTTQILDNSSLVGDLTTNTLQMYTGSITASAVPIGPSFEILGLPTPIPSTNTIFSLAPASNFGTFVISCGVGMTSYSQINYAPTFVQLTFSNPTEPWTAFVTYADSYNWVTLSAQSGTGNSTISVTVSNDPNYNIGSSPLTTRTATLTILTLATPGQLNECTIQQTVYDQYGWSGGIP